MRIALQLHRRADRVASVGLPRDEEGLVAGELRIKGGIAAACSVCGAGAAVPPDASKNQCSSCASVAEYKRCKRCKKTVAFTYSADAMNRLWHCPACDWKGGWRDWKPGVISEYEPAAWLSDLYGKNAAEALSDIQRRRIDGSILSATGVSGLTTGGGTVFFDRESITMMIAKVSRRFRLSYADITSLQIGGRGDVVTTSGGQWSGGGFGAKGIAEGVVVASILNSLTTKTQHHIETIFHLHWTAGSLTLLNTKYLPAQWGSLLSPVIRRIERHQQSASATAGQGGEKVCPFCAETIKAAAIKCRYCGSELPPVKQEPAPEKSTNLRCNRCQHVQAVPLSQSTFVCEECGTKLKRRTQPR
jgi:hypothetical protein